MMRNETIINEQTEYNDETRMFMFYVYKIRTRSNLIHKGLCFINVITADGEIRRKRRLLKKDQRNN